MDSVDRSARLFFDASCLIAAAASPDGGSGFLWSLVEQGYLQAVASQAVLIETEKNLIAKFPAAALLRHRAQMVTGAPEIAAIPHLDGTPRLFPAINAKDEHVVAAALEARVPCILTLDRPLVAETNHAMLGLVAHTPGTFIATLLPTHPSFDIMRGETQGQP